MNNYFASLSPVCASTFSGRREISVQKVPSCAIKYVSNGSGIFGIHGKKIHRITAPVLFWQKPDITYKWGPDENGWTVNYIRFEGSRGYELLEKGFDCLSDNGICIPKNSSILKSLMKKANLICRSPANESSAQLLLLLEEILMYLVQESSTGNLKPEYYGKLELLIKKMVNTPLYDYDFQREAEKLNMSYSHFRRIFKNMTDIPPQEFLIQCRINTAASSLMLTDHPIKQIARKTGYTDIAYFNRLFKKRIGTSPGKYRKIHRMA